MDVGAYGSQSDGGSLTNSVFGQMLFKQQLDLPTQRALSNSNTTFPYYFVGDAAFPLKSYLMKPFPGVLLDEKREYFNKRLSRVRRTIENAFGILTARWRILRGTLNMAPETAEKLVNGTLVLHNFFKMTDGSYCPPGFVDNEINGEIVEGL